MKEINAGSGKRMTGSLTRLSRKIQSTQERNRHDQVGWSRAVTQGRSPVRINRLYEKLSRLIITDIHLLLCSHDLKTWSESESRYHVRKWEKQYMSYFRSHPEDAAAVDHIWQTMSLRVDRENIQFEVPWNDSIMQGQEGFGSSMRHGHILARFLRRMNAMFPAMVICQYDSEIQHGIYEDFNQAQTVQHGTQLEIQVEESPWRNRSNAMI